MKVGIIGSGQIAEIHGPLVKKQPGVEVTGIVDRDLVRARGLAKVLEVDRIYEDAEAMIDAERPDVVHVLVPPGLHAPLSIMAMSKGCHVLVEKPMAPTMTEAQAMVEASRKYDVKLCVGHRMVFEQVVQRAIALHSSGLLGELVSVEAHYVYNARRNPALVEPGAENSHWSYRLNGGPLEDLMPHMASLVVEFMSEIQEVHSVAHRRGVLPEGWDDQIRVLIKSNDVAGYISISLSERPDTIMLTLKGTKGVAQADLFSSILTLRKSSSLPRAVARGLSGFQLSLQYFGESLSNIFKFARGRVDKSGGIEPIISQFYECIRDGGEPPISLEKSLAVVDLVTRVWPAPSVGLQKGMQKKLVASSKASTNGHIKPTTLVTGASGFIGTHLIKKLQSENIRVRALVRPNSIHAGRLSNLDVDVVEGDLSDATALQRAAEGVKTIFHAGAATNNNWDDNQQSTVKGTEYLIQAALDNEVKRFVHFSTLAVHDLLNVHKGANITEDSPCLKDPKSMGAYTYARLQTEEMVLDAHHNHGLAATIVRPGIVVGPIGRIFFPHLGYRYLDTLFLLIGKGDNVLPLTYVENTVDAIYQASLEDEAVGRAYNIVDDGEITVKDYLTAFMQTVGVDARIVALPYPIPYMATAAYELASSANLIKKGLTSRKQLRWKHKSVSFDNTKAKRELGWVPRVPIEEGLTRTFKWYAQQYG